MSVLGLMPSLLVVPGEFLEIYFQINVCGLERMIISVIPSIFSGGVIDMSVHSSLVR